MSHDRAFLPTVQIAALAAITEITASVDFAEQADDAMKDGAFCQDFDTDLDLAISSIEDAAERCGQIAEQLRATAREHLTRTKI
jgi:hypothetical protein